MHRKGDRRTYIEADTPARHYIFGKQPAAPELTVAIKLFYFHRAVLKFHSWNGVRKVRVEQRGKVSYRRWKEARTRIKTTSEDERTNAGSRVKNINVGSPSSCEFERVGHSYIWGQFTKIIQTPDDRKRVSLSKDLRDFEENTSGKMEESSVRLCERCRHLAQVFPFHETVPRSRNSRWEIDDFAHLCKWAVLKCSWRKTRT